MRSASTLQDRYLRLWEFLPVTGDGAVRSSLEAWGRKHGVTYRQIQRDLHLLEEHGSAKATRVGRARHWWRTAFRPGGLRLGSEQAFLVAFATSQLGRWVPPSMLPGLAPIQTAAHELLGRPDYSRERAWFGKLGIVPGLLQRPHVLSTVMSAVVQALFEERWLSIDYENYTREERSATVMPLGLVEADGIPYLVCRFKGHDDNRHVRMDRLSRAETLAEAFRNPAGFQLSQHLESGAFDLGDELIQLRMEMSGGAHKHLLDRPIAADQQLAEADKNGRVIVSATVRNSKQLYWWLLGFGACVEVLEPATLRKELQQEIEAMHQLYAKL